MLSPALLPPCLLLILRAPRSPPFFPHSHHPVEGDCLDVLRDVDEVFISCIREWGLYDKIWQAFAVFLPIKSVGEWA